MSSNLLRASEFLFTDGEAVETNELIELYQSVDWSAYTSKQTLMAQLLPNSLFYRLVRYNGKLVGLIRVVGDGVSIVYVQDLLVHPNYQGRGLGKALLSYVLDKYKTVRQMVLLTDDLESTRKFYEACGLQNAADCKLSIFVRILE